MAVYIIACHMEEGRTGNEHIAEVQWHNRETDVRKTSTRAAMVDWISNQNGEARVADRNSYVEVGVVNANPPYIRTHADGKWTDNLLALPTY